MPTEVQKTLHAQVLEMKLKYRQVSAEPDGSMVYKLPTPQGLGGLGLVIKYSHGHDMYAVTRVSFDTRMAATHKDLGMFCVEDLPNVWK